MPTRLWSAAGLLLLLACAAVRAQGARDASELKSREALRGVETVRLHVEFMPGGALPRAYAQDVIDGTAEQLRAAGLRVVLDDKEAQGLPVFFYRVIMFSEKNGYTGSIDMQLREPVRQLRAPETEVTAATWQHVGYVQLYPSDPARLANGLLSFVNVFVKEYKTANGRPE